ncbi:MAG: protein translocase subunit SecD [Patescibacteria group bacterium]|jgi:preprotein translocase subunit SecD
MIKRKLYIRLAFIAVITAFALVIALPSGPDISLGSFKRSLFIHQGLDLRGGVEITYLADLSKIPASQQDAALTTLKSRVNDRINKFGVTEPTIQVGKSGNDTTLIVELPGVTDVAGAIKQIGQFPDLKFLDQQGNTVITGSDVDSASVTFGTSSGSNNISGEPQVRLQLKDAGKQKFADATTKAAAANPKEAIAIVLDDQVISTPTVNDAITDGVAIISGSFTVQTAKELTNQLNQGALPVPIKIINQQTISATLGAESLKDSLLAGLIGMILIMLFMVIYYKTPGVIAIVALVIYTLINIAIYKLLPVTVTLSGVAGFILSIGMAVDANILIFERMREEIRSGKELLQAIDDGFKRAWTSIRDSNSSTLITALVLYVGTAGLIRGFALTLAIGVLVSLFTAITITQVILKLLAISRFKRLIHV